MNLADQIKDLMIKDIQRRIFEESSPRILQCLNELTPKQVWIATNENTNSVGNLILHLEGNIRQYICHAIGGDEDKRMRNHEFIPSQRLSQDELKNHWTQLMEDAKSVISNIRTEDLTKEVYVQCFEENVTSILIHVAEHLSYHTGQIALMTKQFLNKDLKFYGDLPLDKVGKS